MIIIKLKKIIIHSIFSRFDLADPKSIEELTKSVATPTSRPWLKSSGTRMGSRETMLLTNESTGLTVATATSSVRFDSFFSFF